MIVAGERRYRAMQLLEKSSIEAIVVSGDMDEVALIENMQREELKPLEEAEGVARLIEKHAYTQEDAAQMIGKSRVAVTELLSLMRLPEEIKSECRGRDLATKTFLVELMRLPTVLRDVRV